MLLPVSGVIEERPRATTATISCPSEECEGSVTVTAEDLRSMEHFNCNKCDATFRRPDISLGERKRGILIPPPAPTSRKSQRDYHNMRRPTIRL